MTSFRPLCTAFALVTLTAMLTGSLLDLAHGGEPFSASVDGMATRVSTQASKAFAALARQAKLPPPSSGPTLTLTADPGSPLEGQSVQFTATWSQPVSRASYRFEWGDGQKSDSSQPNANHSYAERGRYIARVLAKAIIDKRAVLIQSNDLTISVSQAQPRENLPLPTLSVNPSTPHPGEAVTFTATIDPSVGPPQYHFYFGDGSDERSETAHITHVYERPSVYRPYVEAILGHGDDTRSSAPIVLTIRPQEMIPRLTVSLLTQQPMAGKYVTVEVRLDPPNKDARYEFDWGDGSPPKIGAENGRAAHIYAVATRYTMTAWAKTRDIAPASSSLVIDIQKAPWSPSLGPIAGLVVLLLAAGSTVGWQLKRRGRSSARPTDGLRVIGHPDTGSHLILRLDQASQDLSLSLTLRPGIDPGADRITFM